jgi:phosphonate transport system substrate-binding protein
MTSWQAAAAISLVLGSFAGPATLAQADECLNRGELDTRYCDADSDLVADPPRDSKQWRDPSTLVFAYAPVEDPAIYQNIFRPFIDQLGTCTGKRTVYYPVHSNAAQVEAMRAGRLHLAIFATGTTGFAVNLAGAVVFASLGTE